MQNSDGKSGTVKAMDKQWYVLYVKTGTETDIQKRLVGMGIEAAVPIENRMIRTGGKWITKPYVVFPGYVFVHILYNWALYYIMARISGVIRILGGGETPVPLTEKEAKSLLYEQELFADIPVVRVFDGGFEVMTEKHKDFAVSRINRHQRRITFRTTIAGKETEFTLSFIKA